MKTPQWQIWLVGHGAGVLLTAMLKLNSLLGSYTTPIFASWAAHGVGTVVTVCLLIGVRLKKKPIDTASPIQSPEWWTHLGGIPGAFAVILAIMVVNSLGLVGAISLMLTGQILFGMAVDHFGLFKSQQRRICWVDFVVGLCVVGGSTLVIAF